MHTAALDNRVPDLRFPFFINFFHSKKKHSFLPRIRQVQDFPGHGPLSNCSTHTHTHTHTYIYIYIAPLTHISSHFPMLQASERIRTMILLLAVEQATVSIKGHNVMSRSTIAPWIPMLFILICSCHHLSVHCLHFALHSFDVIPWCASRHKPCQCMVPVPLCIYLSSCVLVGIHRRMLSRVLVCPPPH